MSDTLFYLLIACMFWILPGFYVYKNIPDKKEVSILGIVVTILPIVNFLIFMLISRDEELQEHEKIVQQLENNKLRYIDELLNMFKSSSTTHQEITLKKLVNIIEDWIEKDLNLKAKLHLMSQKEREKVDETITLFIQDLLLINQKQLLIYLYHEYKPDEINEALIKVRS